MDFNFQYNHQALAKQMRESILSDFKNELTKIFMEKAKEAVEESVNTIMKSVNGELQYQKSVLTAQTIFDIKFSVSDNALQ